MSGTVVDSLNDATAAINAATAALNTLEATLDAKIAAAQTAASTVINNFLARPGTQTWWVDPSGQAGGSDANDGLTPTTPKQSVEPLLQGMQNTPTAFFLFSDVTLHSRIQVQANLTFTGVAHATNAQGFVFQQRKLKADLNAVNSPNPIIGTFCAGLWIDGAHLTTSHVDVELQDVDPSYGNRSVFSTTSGASFLFGNMNLTADSANSGSLVSSTNGKATVYCALALGLNAAGHIFAGVAAGQDPNSHFEYVSNLTSG